jgi:sporulation protein YlmC with PRC-barrel domain
MRQSGFELGGWVVDRGLIDRNGRRAGVVDDLLIELPEPGVAESALPRVVALQTGPMALSENLWPPLRGLARLIYRLLGLREARPVEIPWQHVSAIDVVVHLDLSRDEAGLDALASAVRRRFIGRIPGS